MLSPDANLLAGKSLLVVEEDIVLAREMRCYLEALGATVIGPAPSVHYARLIVGKRHLDGAIFDVSWVGEELHEFADMLNGKGVPILLAMTAQQQRVGPGPGLVETMGRPICLESLISKVAAMKPIVVHRKVERAPERRRTERRLSLQERFARSVVRALRPF